MKTVFNFSQTALSNFSWTLLFIVFFKQRQNQPRVLDGLTFRPFLDLESGSSIVRQQAIRDLQMGVNILCN